MGEFLIGLMVQIFIFIIYKLIDFELAIICCFGIVTINLLDIKYELKYKEEEDGHKRNSR